MPSWDDDRGYRSQRDRAWERRREDDRDASWRGRDRWFGSEEREPLGRDRYASRFDRDRAIYGAGYDFDHDEYGRARWTSRFGGGRDYGGEAEAYGGQEYGLEGHSGHAASDWGYADGGHDGSRAGGEALGPSYGAPGRTFAFRRQAESGQEFDPDYLDWRDEQMRAHDRDYQEWRRQQHQQYDDEYRRFCSERREHFGRTFHEWRAQRSAPPAASEAGGSGTSGMLGMPVKQDRR